jgi:hypothetical protein
MTVVINNSNRVYSIVITELLLIFLLLVIGNQFTNIPQLFIFNNFQVL